MVNAVTDIQEDTMVEIVLSTAQLGDDDIGKSAVCLLFCLLFLLSTIFCFLFFRDQTTLFNGSFVQNSYIL